MGLLLLGYEDFEVMIVLRRIRILLRKMTFITLEDNIKNPRFVKVRFKLIKSFQILLIIAFKTGIVFMATLILQM